MKILYTQNWKNAESLARHSWNFFLIKQDATIDAMSSASYEAWMACYAIWHEELSEAERDIISTFTLNQLWRPDRKKDIEQYAESQGVTVDTVWSVYKRACKLWAVKRGVADE